MAANDSPYGSAYSNIDPNAYMWNTAEHRERMLMFNTMNATAFGNRDATDRRVLRGLGKPKYTWQSTLGPAEYVRGRMSEPGRIGITPNFANRSGSYGGGEVPEITGMRSAVGAIGNLVMAAAQARSGYKGYKEGYSRLQARSDKAAEEASLLRQKVEAAERPAFTAQVMDDGNLSGWASRPAAIPSSSRTQRRSARSTSAPPSGAPSVASTAFPGKATPVPQTPSNAPTFATPPVSTPAYTQVVNNQSASVSRFEKEQQALQAKRQADPTYTPQNYPPPRSTYREQEWEERMADVNASPAPPAPPAVVRQWSSPYALPTTSSGQPAQGPVAPSPWHSVYDEMANRNREQYPFLLDQRKRAQNPSP